MADEGYFSVLRQTVWRWIVRALYVIFPVSIWLVVWESALISEKVAGIITLWLSIPLFMMTLPLSLLVAPETVQALVNPMPSGKTGVIALLILILLNFGLIGLVKGTFRLPPRKSRLPQAPS